MPGKNTIKIYEGNAFYHLYNRGVNKQLIFKDEQDYGVFLSYLKTYLEPKNEITLRSVIIDENASWKEKAQAAKLLRLNNFFDTITLVSYCLMPNHFHLLVKQTDADAIDRFMNSLCTRYTMYFNKKYKWVGSIFQSVYKAIQILSDDQLLYLTHYIHRNPHSIINKSYSNYLASKGEALRSWEFSSYQEYLGLRKTAWVKPKEILSFFSKSGYTSYQSFVEDESINEMSLLRIAPLLIDEK
jgi:REP element-mobilizing transposase RayT